MDNVLQIKEIRKYQKHLSNVLGRDIDENIAAQIWIRKYAQRWRTAHPKVICEKAAA